jgi:hypothetical protein
VRLIGPGYPQGSDILVPGPYILISPPPVLLACAETQRGVGNATAKGPCLHSAPRWRRDKSRREQRDELASQAGRGGLRIRARGGGLGEHFLRSTQPPLQHYSMARDGMRHRMLQNTHFSTLTCACTLVYIPQCLHTIDNRGSYLPLKLFNLSLV